MIDWRVVWTNGLWIVGTAVLLGTISYTYWLAQTLSAPVVEIIRQAPFNQLFWLSFLLIFLGLIFTSRRWWETAVWLLFCGWTLFNLAAAVRRS